MDLANEVWNNQISFRRLAVLIRGLPLDAAVWREDQFPPAEELTAVLIESQDAWNRAIVEALCGENRVNIPGKLEIRRPQPKAQEAQSFTTDVVAIGAFFSSV